MENFCPSEQILNFTEEINKQICATQQAKSGKIVSLCKDICESSKRLYDFNNEAKQIAEDMQLSYDAKIDRGSEINDLTAALKVPNYSLAVIGDTGTGKSTLINLIVQKSVLPTGVIQTTTPFIELRYNETVRLFTSNSYTQSNLVEQDVTFHNAFEQPSDLLARFLEDDSRYEPLVRVRMDYPFPLLKSGIIICESLGFNGSHEFKETFKKNINASDMIICVLNGDITTDIETILMQLVESGRDLASIFFVINPNDDYSLSNIEKTVTKTQDRLREINSAFDRSKIVVFNVKAAFDMLNYCDCYTEDYIDFMENFMEFICKIVTFKNERIFKGLRNMLQNGSISIELMCYQITSLIERCRKRIKKRQQRQMEYENAQDRWKHKLTPLIINLFHTGSTEISQKLHSSKFKSDFESATNYIPIPTNEMEGMNEIRETENVKFYKDYLLAHFEKVTKSILLSYLDMIVSDGINILGTIFCDDIAFDDRKRERFLEKLQDVGKEPMLMHFWKIIDMVLEHIRINTEKSSKTGVNRVFTAMPGRPLSRTDVSRYDDTVSLNMQDAWEKLRSSEAKEFHDALRKRNINRIIRKYLRSYDYVSSVTQSFLEKIQIIYIRASKDADNQSHQLDAAKNLLERIVFFQKNVIAVNRSWLNEIHPSCDAGWSLSTNALENMTLLRRMRMRSSKYYLPEMTATLKIESIPKSIKVQVNRLSGDFCAEHVLNQAHLKEYHAEKNILRCYGAYRQGCDIFLVTEPWKYTLRSALTSELQLSEENRLQIAIDLTDICARHTLSIPTNQLQLNALLITQEQIVKLNLVGHPVISESYDETQRESELIYALSKVFVKLLKNIRGSCQFINSLCASSEESDMLLCNQWNKRFTIKQILCALEYIQAERKIQALRCIHPLLNSRRPVGLIAIDGGGTRGVIAAMILERIQKVAKQPLWKIFQYGAGSSTGGLIILSALLRRSTTHELVTMYRQLSSKIFRPRLNPTRPHSLKPFVLELEKHFGNMKMIRTNDDAPYVFVVTKENHEPYPFLVRNYNVSKDPAFLPGGSDWSCIDAARATAAAPTYFDAFVRDGNHYVDGAMGYDNPVLLLFHEFLTLSNVSNMSVSHDQFRKLPIDYIVSIGTGNMESQPPPSGSPRRGLGHVMKTVQVAIEWLADSETAHYHMQTLAKAYGNIPYFRFNPKLSKRVALDESSEEELKRFVRLTENYLDDHQNQVPQMFQQLANLINSV